MSNPQVIDKPKRWDLPFSHDLPHPLERRDMSDADLARLLAMEPFRSMQAGRFPRTIPLDGILRNDTRIRRFRNGDVVVRQGDYGNSAFLILDGRVRVILEGLNPRAIGRRERHERSWLRSIGRLLTNPRSPEVRDADSYPQRSAANTRRTLSRSRSRSANGSIDAASLFARAGSNCVSMKSPNSGPSI